LIPFLTGIINRVRGGLCLLGNKFDKMSASKWYLDWFVGDGGLKHSLVFAGITLYFTGNLVLSGVVLVSLYIGEKFSWGLWIGELTEGRKELNKKDNDDGKNEGIRFLAGLFFDEEKNWYQNSIVSLMFRAFYWFGPTIIAFWYFGGVSIMITLYCLVAVMVAMPLSYILGKFLFEKVGGIKLLEVDGAWPMGEVIYGVIQGIILVVLLLHTVLVF
jgi:hypothetical protein